MPHPRTVDTTIDTTGRWTRGQVAKRLGCSIPTVRKLEGRALHPIRGNDGMWWFDPDEVERVALMRGKNKPRQAPTRGRLAAMAFSRFEAGKELPEIVIELEQPPEVIRELYAAWKLGLEEGYERERREEARRKQEEREERELAEVRKAYEREAKEIRREEARQARAVERAMRNAPKPNGDDEGSLPL